MKMKEKRTNEPAPPANREANATEQPPTGGNGSRITRLIKRFGLAGFLFFLIKGVVLYILIPLGLFKWLGGC